MQTGKDIGTEVRNQRFISKSLVLQSLIMKTDQAFGIHLTQVKVKDMRMEHICDEEQKPRDG
jgi:hypothetical protein